MTTTRAGTCAFATLALDLAQLAAATFRARIGASGFREIAIYPVTGFPDLVCGMRPVNADGSSTDRTW